MKSVGDNDESPDQLSQSLNLTLDSTEEVGLISSETTSGELLSHFRSSNGHSVLIFGKLMTSETEVEVLSRQRRKVRDRKGRGKKKNRKRGKKRKEDRESKRRNRLAEREVC